MKAKIEKRTGKAGNRNAEGNVFMKHWRKPRTSRSINLCRGRENKGRLCGDRRTEQRRPSWSCAEVAITDMLLGAALSRRREVTEAFLTFILATVERIKEIERRTKKKPTLCTLDRNKERQRKKKQENVYGTEGQEPHPDTMIPYTPLALSDVMVWDPRCFLYPTRSIPSMFFSPPIELGDDNGESRETDRNDLYAVNRAWKESPTDRLKWKNAVVRTKQIYRVYTKCKKKWGHRVDMRDDIENNKAILHSGKCNRLAATIPPGVVLEW